MWLVCCLRVGLAWRRIVLDGHWVDAESREQPRGGILLHIADPIFGILEALVEVAYLIESGMEDYAYLFQSE
jgi:hypothetical protein